MIEIHHRSTGEVLHAVDADTLVGADLAGADLPDGVPVVEDIDTRILAVFEAGSGDMGTWHSPCGTTHCRAGWAIHLAGDAGYALEKRYGPATAGALIYAVSRPGRVVPDFYATNAGALADLRQCAAEAS